MWQVSVVIMIVGLLIWLLSNPNSPNPNMPKIAEAGRIMFAFGLLAWLLAGDKFFAFILGR